MTILGIGTDIARIERFRMASFPRRLASFYLSDAEYEALEHSSDLAQSLASRFAAKEAVIKATPEKLAPHDFEILKEGPRPVVRWLRALPYDVHVSIAHESEYATAVAICTAHP